MKFLAQSQLPYQYSPYPKSKPIIYVHPHFACVICHGTLEVLPGCRFRWHRHAACLHLHGARKATTPFEAHLGTARRRKPPDFVPGRVWSSRKNWQKRTQTLNVWYIYLPGDSKWPLYPLFGGNLAIERVTFSPSQKVHQLNCQVHYIYHIKSINHPWIGLYVNTWT